MGFGALPVRLSSPKFCCQQTHSCIPSSRQTTAFEEGSSKFPQRGILARRPVLTQHCPRSESLGPRETLALRCRNRAGGGGGVAREVLSEGNLSATVSCWPAHSPAGSVRLPLSTCLNTLTAELHSGPSQYKCSLSRCLLTELNLNTLVHLKNVLLFRWRSIEPAEDT